MQVLLIHRLGKRRPKNSRKNPPNRKIGFMYKRTEKTRKQRAEQKDEVVYLGAQPEHPRDSLTRRAKNTAKKLQRKMTMRLLI